MKYKKYFMISTTTTFIVYILAMLIIGIAAARMTNSLNDYVLGGRSLGRVVTALSAGASDMSGWLLLGLPGALYVAGISEAWIAIGLTVGSWCNWKFVAARLRSFTANASDALTLPDYLSARFCDKYRISAVVAAVIILIFFVVYCASGMVSAARLFEQTFEMDYRNALLIGAVSTIFYVFIGGFLAVSWTDTVQAAMMCVALVVTPIVVMTELGGFSETIDKVSVMDVSMLDMFKGQTAVGIASLLAWGLGYFGQPHLLVRFMATKSIKVIPTACRTSIIWMLFCLAGAVSVGFFGYAYFAEHVSQGAPVNANPELVFIVLTQVLFNPWIAGVLMSAILAAVMSTLSCQLLVCSSTLTEDFYRAFIRPQASTRELIWFGRAMVLMVSLVAIFIAMDPQSKVLGLVSYAWAGFGASFGPVIIMSLWWKKMTKNGALAGMITGAVTVIVWNTFGWFGLYEIIPGFFLALLAIVVFSLIGQKPSQAMKDIFDEVQTSVRQERDLS